MGGCKYVMDTDGGWVQCRLSLLYLATPMRIESAFGAKDLISEQCCSLAPCAVYIYSELPSVDA